MIEVSTTFEGHEFVIDRLFRGSVINYRTFFMEEGAAVTLKFGKASVLQVLPYEVLKRINEKHSDLNKTF